MMTDAPRRCGHADEHAPEDRQNDRAQPRADLARLALHPRQQHSLLRPPRRPPPRHPPRRRRPETEEQEEGRRARAWARWPGRRRPRTRAGPWPRARTGLLGVREDRSVRCCCLCCLCEGRARGDGVRASPRGLLLACPVYYSSRVVVQIVARTTLFCPPVTLVQLYRPILCFSCRAKDGMFGDERVARLGSHPGGGCWATAGIRPCLLPLPSSHRASRYCFSCFLYVVDPSHGKLWQSLQPGRYISGIFRLG